MVDGRERLMQITHTYMYARASERSHGAIGAHSVHIHAYAACTDGHSAVERPLHGVIWNDMECRSSDSCAVFSIGGAGRDGSSMQAPHYGNGVFFFPKESCLDT